MRVKEGVQPWTDEQFSDWFLDRGQRKRWKFGVLPFILKFPWLTQRCNVCNTCSHDGRAAGFIFLFPKSLWWWITLQQHAVSVQYLQPQPSCPWLQTRWQDETVILGKCWKKKKILNWLAMGERTERLLKIRALQKMLGSTSKESLLLFHHASSLGRWDPVGKYSLEMPSSNVSWGIQPFYSRFSEEIRIKYASCQPKAEMHRNSFISLQLPMLTSEGEMTALILDILSLTASFSPHKMKSPFYTNQLSGLGPA